MNPHLRDITQFLFRNLNQGVLILSAILCTAPTNAQDILLSDFEQNTYEWLPGGSWTATGSCFGTGPAQGTLTGQNAVTGYQGKGLVNTFLSGDVSQGTLTSPPFTITRKYIRFLIGAGNWRPQTSLNLLIDGKVVRTSVGMGDREQLDWLQWDVSGHMNQNAQVQITDKTIGGWGHINVDHIIATDTPMASIIVPGKDYLLLPVKTGESKRLVELVLEGLVVREMNVELSSTPDFWVFMDLKPFVGQELIVRLDSKLASSSDLQTFFVQSDSITTSTPMYNERLRPIYHFSPKRGFLADPNDLVYKDGEYHMSYQHNPFGREWDNLHHGHAVSTDLVHWEELPEAIYPTYSGEAWNGSSVVDWNNTAGFGSGTIVTLYTSGAGWADNPRYSKPNRFSQSLAYSTDNGRTFEYYEGNPVIPNFHDSEHDPVVFWFEPENVWVMILFVGDSGGYHIFNSTDLKNWVFKSSIDIAGTTEVPDLFPLALDGDVNNVKWIFSAGYRQYIVGTFDGKTFTREHGPFWFARQQWDLSAALTFNHTPDGRRVMLSNGRTEYPGMPFNRYMNLPNVLTLKTNSVGEPRVHINPVAEVSNLRTDTTTWSSQTLNTGVNLMEGVSGEGVEMEIVFKPGSKSLVTFKVGEHLVTYDNSWKILSAGEKNCCTQHRSLSPVDGNVHLRMFYDRGSWEVFANNGEFYMPIVLVPKEGNWPLSLTTENDPVEIVSLSLHRMGSIWGSNGFPTVSISLPENGTSFASDSSVSIIANAADPDGTISKVEFFANGESIGIDTSSPYSIDWTIGIGNFSLTAVATDNAGATTTSSTVSVIGTNASSLHVASITTATASTGGGNQRGSATVIIKDNLGNPVPNTTVTGTFSGSFAETNSGITGLNGSVRFITAAQLTGTLTVDFCVTNVTHSLLTYDSSANVINCSGNGIITGVSDPGVPEMPETDVQVYPNPFNDKLVVMVNLLKESNVHCSLIDSKGSLVGVLYADRMPAGTHYLQYGREINDGLYYVRTMVDHMKYTTKTHKVK